MTKIERSTWRRNLSRDGLPPPAKKVHGLNMLHRAAAEGDYDLLTVCISYGLRVNTSPCRTTALMRAAAGGHVECVQILCNEGAHVDAMSSFTYWPALLYAAQRGCENCLSILLDFGANIDGEYGTRSTALMVAATRGNARCVDILIQRGANADLKDMHGNTALMLAVQHGHVDCATKLGAVRRSFFAPIQQSLPGGKILAH